MTYRCPRCGSQFTTGAPIPQAHCPNCGTVFNTGYNAAYQQGWQQPPRQQQSTDVFSPGPSGKSRGVAGLLAILLGSLGVHYFYMGKTTMGVVFLLIALLSCGTLATITGIFSIIQGIIFLTISQEEFERRFLQPEYPLF